MITASKHALQGICTVDIDMAWGVLGLGHGPGAGGVSVQPDSRVAEQQSRAQHSTAQHTAQQLDHHGMSQSQHSRFFFFFHSFLAQSLSLTESESD